MRECLSTKTLRNIASLAILVAMTTGCAQMQEWLTSLRGPKTNESVILGAPGVGHYIEEMYRLASGDPATQAEIYADAESAAKLTPGPSTRLRYALVLATPGYSGSNPEEAQIVFRDLLSQTELMSPAEISLASIHLKIVEQQIVLGAETRRLRSANSRAIKTEAQRTANIESENRQLRRSLEEAEQKLEAITSIERSIREQSDSGTVQN